VRVREDEIYPDFWEIKKNNLNRQLPADGSFIMENIVYPPIDQKPPPLRGRPTWNKFTNDSMAHILKTRPVLEYLDLLNDTETASFFDGLYKANKPMDYMFKYDNTLKMIMEQYLEEFWWEGIMAFGKSPLWKNYMQQNSKIWGDGMLFSKEEFMSRDLSKFIKKITGTQQQKDHIALAGGFVQIVDEIVEDPSIIHRLYNKTFGKEFVATGNRNARNVELMVEKWLNENPPEKFMVLEGNKIDPNIFVSGFRYDDDEDGDEAMLKLPSDDPKRRLPLWVDEKDVKVDEQGREYIELKDHEDEMVTMLGGDPTMGGTPKREYLFDWEPNNDIMNWTRTQGNSLDMDLRQNSELEMYEEDPIFRKLRETKAKWTEGYNDIKEWREEIRMPTPAPTYLPPTPAPTPFPSFATKPLGQVIDPETVVSMYNPIAFWDEEEDGPVPEGPEEPVIQTTLGKIVENKRVALFSIPSPFSPLDHESRGPEIAEGMEQMMLIYDAVIIVSPADPLVLRAWAIGAELDGKAWILSDPKSEIASTLDRICFPEGHNPNGIPTRFSCVLNNMVVEKHFDGDDLSVNIDDNLSISDYPASVNALLSDGYPELAKIVRNETFHREEEDKEAEEETKEMLDDEYHKYVLSYYDHNRERILKVFGHYNETGEFPGDFDPENPFTLPGHDGYSEPLLEAQRLFSPRETRWDSPMSVASPDTAELTDELIRMEQRNYVQNMGDYEKEWKFWRERKRDADQPMLSELGYKALESGSIYFDPVYGTWTRRNRPENLLKTDELAGPFTVRDMVQQYSQALFTSRMYHIHDTIKGMNDMEIDHESGLTYNVWEGIPGLAQAKQDEYELPEWALESIMNRKVEQMQNLQKGLTRDGEAPSTEKTLEDYLNDDEPDYDE